ncbi:efflux RND transporter permease subunit [Methylocystis parvus]|uniref:MMPL family transporter n=1 Tax=Methylocystis parvus TaxID=134 RepID=A0A6B8M7W0_9HYPH|nr:efflux RND transporter permease subunit [Methylocystis parvus]QGN00185.1 MMPL family transporter [Methylocystis parvus]WBK02505.1 efflux RND transporter permease subunit [Methylocystis parvus OBBP]
MNISTLFILRPIATFLLMLALLVGGVTAYFLLPVAAMPEIEFPTIVVTANLPGADPETMAASVAQPLERQFAALPGVNQISSTSILGFTQVTLQFDLSRQLDGAASDVQAAISAAQGNLPKNLPTPPTYRKVNPADSPVIILGLTSKALPLETVDQYADLNIAQQIATMSGVGQVLIFGQQTFAPTIKVNPAALAWRGIGLDAVASAVSNNTAQLPVGALQGSERALQIGTNGQLFNPKDIGRVIVAYRNGAPVRLDQVANVVVGPQDPLQAGWVKLERGEMIGIWRQPGANTLELVDAIKAALPRLRQGMPASIELSVVSDRSVSIRESFADVKWTLVAAVVLVILVIFAFLRNIRAAAIPSVTVPLSLVGTFAAMYVLGYTLDNLSLMGLTLAVGLVVDDAIVMVENIFRYLERGQDAKSAAIDGAQEIGFTIVSITISLIAVFIPILFMSGIVGRLFREFGVVVSTAVALSALIALTLSPMMASLLLLNPEEARHGRLYDLSERAFDRVVAFYTRGLDFTLRHQPSIMTLNIALIFASGWLFYHLPKGFFPQEDTGIVFGVTQADEDISFDGMAQRQQKVAEIIAQDPAVESFGSFIGGGASSGMNTGRFFIQLKPFTERLANADAIIQRLRGKFSEVPGVMTFLQSIQNIRIGARLTATQYQYTLRDIDLRELNDWAPRVFAKMRTLHGLLDVASDQQTGGSRLMINVDRDAAERLGVHVTGIQQTLYDSFGKPFIAQLYGSTNTYRVILEVERQYQTGASAISRIYVNSANGKLIPVQQFATLQQMPAPIAINHENQVPAVTISFNLASDVALGQAVAETETAMTEIGAPSSLQGSFSGTAREFQRSLSTQPLLIAAALFVVYIVLGVLYESFAHPVTILLSLPSAAVGALFFLNLFGFDLTMMAIIGLLMLIGIVKKNAIMMVDFAIERTRRESMSPQQAIHEAAILRFRPILMTTMAAIFVTLPLAVGFGAGAELRQPLGIGVVGGLIVSQALTIFTTPVTYLYMEQVGTWLSSKFGRGA